MTLLFQKRRWSCDFPSRKALVAQKHRAISHQEKMASSTLRQVALRLPSPPPDLVRAYANVTTKFSRNERLPDFELLLVLRFAAQGRKGALLR